MPSTVAFASRAQVVVCALLLSICAAFTAYNLAFVSLTNYDDEGYMMWTVRSLLGGQPLYDQVTTVYGPFYYLYEWCVLSLTRLPASADSLRLVSTAFWVAAALVAFLLVYRTTHSLLLAACVHLVVFRALGFIGEETAHPQEACIFLLLALAWAFYIANPTIRMVIMGALAGAMAASKINLGIFVVVALIVALAYEQRPGLRRSAVCTAAALGALALPVMLMWDRRTEIWAVSFCLLVILSLASSLLTVRGMPWKSGRGLHDATVAAGAFAATVAAICSFPLSHGSTLHNLFESLIVMPRKNYGQSWAVPANIHFTALLWAVLGLVLAVSAWKCRIPERWLAWLKIGFGAATLLMCATDRYLGLFNFATPFIWLVAARPTHALSDERTTLARALLALLGVIQVLYAYPVAGSQIGFVTIFIIVIAGICFWDGLSWIRESRLGSHHAPRGWWPTGTQVIAIQLAAALLIGGLNLAFAWNAHRTYQSFSALNFPGARHVRIQPDKAATLRAIVARINSSCGILVTEPGLFSFHLWTGKASPVGVDHQVWMSLLDDASQNAIVREIAADPRACVVYQQEIVDLWTKGRDVSAKPLVRYIRENFQPVIEGYGYRLLVRRPAATADPSH